MKPDILYMDRQILVCRKPSGLLSEEKEGVVTLPSSLMEHLTQIGESNIALYPVHRLDRDVGGVVVLARDRASASKLSASFADKTVTVKRYFAILCGCPENEQGEWCDLLYHDPRQNKTFVVNKMRRGVREAKLEYRVLDRRFDADRLDYLSLCEMTLITGRTHQIRVQSGSRKLPLLGDGRYGGGAGQMALWSYCLSFVHPGTGHRMTFVDCPAWDCFAPFANALASRSAEISAQMKADNNTETEGEDSLYVHA